MQHLNEHLLEHESEETLKYLNHSISKPGECVGNRSYIIGRCKLITPSREQSTALNYTGDIEVYYRLLRCGIMYHSSKYRENFQGKRDNRYCCYRTTSGNFCFGRIELFAKTPTACAGIGTFAYKFNDKGRPPLSECPSEVQIC